MMNGGIIRRAMIAASAAALVLAASALALPAQAQDSDAEIEAAVAGIVDAFNAGDADAFAELFTDEGLAAFVEEPGATREESIAIVEEFMGFGTVELLDVRDVQVEGDSASAIAELSIGFVSIDLVEFTRIDGAWIVSNYTTGVEQPEPPEIPAGYETIEVDLVDYNFEFDKSQIQVGDKVAFEATNMGQEPHEMVLVKVPADLDLEEALNSPEPPEGIEDIAFTFAVPGQTGVAIAENALEAGRYVMLCFVETEEGTPHVALGMIEEFTLEEEDDDDDKPTPAAPNTGSGTETGSADALPSAWVLSVVGAAILLAGGTVAGRTLAGSRE